MVRNQIIARRTKSGINWVTATFIILFHVGALAALFLFSWQALAATVLLWVISGMGIGMGYHRLLTHRGYKSPRWVEYFLTLCGVMALESGPISWVVTHRIHHAHTDTDGDPHSPRDGGWWSHIGWMLKGTAQQHEPETIARYAPDLVKDPFYVWLNRWYFLPIIASGLLLLALGGWPMVTWAVFLRIVVGWHATWLVNSATHMWGSRRFKTTDDSTNNLWVALITFGEGWHNNHHAHPRSARHGLAWYEIDINWWGIRALQLLGLARSIKLTNMSAERDERADMLKAA